MSDRLLEYYERELTYLRRAGAEFARAYPKVAGRLELEETKCEDPHVERLLEGFAFLAARVHLRLDDDLPEVSEALLASVHPQYVRPFPSATIVAFDLDPSQSQLADGFRVARGSTLQSQPVGGEPCRFRSCFDTVVWPLEVESAGWGGGGGGARSPRSREAAGAIRLTLRAFPGGSIGDLNLDSLRLHLNADAGLTAALYELLLNNCLEVVVRDPTPGSRIEPFSLGPEEITPVGFHPGELLLDPPRRSLLAYSLLQEVFAFPEKFNFIDLGGLEKLRERGFGEKVEFTFQLRSFERTDWRNRLDDSLDASAFRLGCTPAVNLFGRTSEPLLLTQKRTEYPVVPDLRRQASIFTYSVDEVRLVSPDLPEPRRVQPFYAPVRSHLDEGMYWRERRRTATRGGDDRPVTELCFVDVSDRTIYPDEDVATLRLTCFNGDLPSRLPIGGGRGGDFRLDGGGPLRQIEALRRPTPAIMPELGRARIWRLISQLSLNYGSLLEGGAVSLRQLLQLQNLAAGAGGERQIEGIREVRSEAAHARVRTEHGISFARGHRIEILFDEDDFAGGSVYLLASVLDRFFGLYTSMNSFTSLRARSLQRKEPIREWPPRAGWKTLV